MKKLLLKNARIVNEGTISEGDVRIADGRIEATGRQLAAEGCEVIDLEGLYLLPGIIDDQVHFREPGLTHKASIGSESYAAIAGGVTSFFDMPNTNPPSTTVEALQAKKAIAARSSFANYGFYLGATNDNLDEIRRAGPEDACGIKVFMGASTGNMLVDKEETLAGIFAEARLPVVTHCEDSPMIWAAEAEARERFGEDVPMSAHPLIRSEEACYKSSSFAVGLAREHGTRLHVLHLTTARELELFDAGPIADKRITVEVCVHHLWFEDSDYETLGSWIKCNPAVKTAADRDALRAAVNSDVIDVIATDHAPHTLEEKAGKYFDAPAGLPLVQHMLPALLELHQQGVFTLEKIVQKAAHNPATRFGIVDRGFIREGYFADFAVVDLDARQTVTRQDVRYRCGWSPFEGTVFNARVRMTIVNGRIVYRDGAKLDDEPVGQALTFRAG